MLTIIWYLCAVWLVDAACVSLFTFSPIALLRRVGRRALTSTERERLLALEDAEADRTIRMAEAGRD